MPIEFRCTQCQRLLRTQDDAAGKQAKCPECGTILVVPTPEVGSADAPPPPVSPAGSPFASPQNASNPFGSSPLPRGGVTNPYQSPVDYMPGPVHAGSTEVIAPTALDLGDIFSRTWTILTNQYGMSLAIFAVTGLVSMAVVLAGGLILGGLIAARVDPIIILFVRLLVMVGYWLFAIWLNIGAALCYLRIARGQPVAIGEIFAGGPYLLRVLAATLLFLLILMALSLVSMIPLAVVAVLVATTIQTPAIVAVGVLIFVAVASIVSIVAALGFSQYYYLLLDQNVGSLESLSLSWKITRGNRLMLFAIWTVAGIMGVLVSLLTGGLGAIFLAAPFLSLMMPVIYLAMTGQPTADRLYRPM